MTDPAVKATTRPRGFITWRPQRKTMDLLALVQTVLEEYAAFLPLTVRQIFYRLVGVHGYEKSERAYERLAEHLQRARRAEMIPFDYIRDDGNTRSEAAAFSGLDEIRQTIRAAVDRYRLDRQIGQPVRTLLICEAAGMVPQLARVAHPFCIPVLSAGGFDGTTGKHDLAREIAASVADEERPVRVLHIGDHDPSGVHIGTALGEDLAAFVPELLRRRGLASDWGRFERIAVLPDHVTRYGLPTAPAKATDRRSFAGVGDDPTATVQAEALPPDILASIAEAAIRSSWDDETEAWVARREAGERHRLTNWLDQWGEI